MSTTVFEDSSLQGDGGAAENWAKSSFFEEGAAGEELENQPGDMKLDSGSGRTMQQQQQQQRAFGEEIGSTVVNCTFADPSMTAGTDKMPASTQVAEVAEENAPDDDAAAASWVSFGNPKPAAAAPSSLQPHNSNIKVRSSLAPSSSFSENATQQQSLRPSSAAAPRASLPSAKTLSGLQQRRMESSSHGVSTVANHKAGMKGGPFRSYTTPVRIQSKAESLDVQATNDGYASVAQLSAWLADDPTRSKSKVRQIRRGANVIAKSRKFDKALANVKIIEEELVLRGHVRETRNRLEQHSSSSYDDDTVSVASSARFETASAVSVQDKKEWLANAFRRDPAAANPHPPKAKTDVVTSRDEVEDVTARAKHLWRQRTPPRKPSAASEALSSTDKVKSAPPPPIPVSIFSSPPTKASGSSESTLASTPTRAPEREAPKVCSDARENSSMSEESLPVPSMLQWDASAVTDEDDTASLTSFDVPPSALESLAPRPTAAATTTTIASPQVSRSVRSSPARFDESNRPDGNVHLTSSASGCTGASSSPARDHRLEELQRIRQRGVVRTTADRFAVKPVPPPTREPVEDDPDKPLDFQAARELIIRRSQKNGNSVEAVSKVGRRKAQFEKLHLDQRRKSLASIGQPPLKASWRPEDCRGGVGCGATTKYKKTYVVDLAPKKSFDELP